MAKVTAKGSKVKGRGSSKGMSFGKANGFTGKDPTRFKRGTPPKGLKFGNGLKARNGGGGPMSSAPRSATASAGSAH